MPKHPRVPHAPAVRGDHPPQGADGTVRITVEDALPAIADRTSRHQAPLLTRDHRPTPTDNPPPPKRAVPDHSTVEGPPPAFDET